MKTWKLALVSVLALGALTYAIGAPIAGWYLNRDSTRRNQDTIATLCVVLADVIHTSYNQEPLDPKKVAALPAATRQLLTDLGPLLALQAKDGGNERRVLAKLHGAGRCP